MTTKPDKLTVVILSEPEAKEVSVRCSLKCIGRDFGYLLRAIWNHFRRFMNTTSRGWTYTNNWWTRKR